MRPYTSKYVKLTESEWLRVFSKLSATRLRFQIIFLVIGVAISIAGLAIGLNDPVGKALTYVGFGTAGGAIGDRVYFFWAIKKSLADPQNEKLFAEARAVVDEDGVKLESKNGVTTFYPWDLILRAEEMGDMRLLYIGKSSAIVMQNRSHTAEDWDNLAQWIAANVSG